MSISLGVGLALALAPAAAAAPARPRDGGEPLWNLVWITDTQYHDREWITPLIRAAAAHQPSMVLHTGDAIFERGDRKPWKDVLDVMREADPPLELHVSPGNHDLIRGYVLEPSLLRAAARGVYPIAGGDAPPDAPAPAAAEVCGPGWPVWNPEVAVHPNWQPGGKPPYRYVFRRGGIRFIVLDCYWSPEQEAWVRDFIVRPDDSSATILLQHEHTLDRIENYVKGLERRHNVRLMLTGHDHNFRQEERHGVTFITGAGLAQGPERDSDAFTLWVHRYRLRLDRHRRPKGLPVQPIQPPETIWSCGGEFDRYVRLPSPGPEPPRDRSVLGGGLENLAPFARVHASAMTDGSRGPQRVNDENPDTYWSAWPYTIREKEDRIVFELTLPWPAEASLLSVAADKWPAKAQLEILRDGAYSPHGAEAGAGPQGPVWRWNPPQKISGLRFTFPDVRKDNGGVSMSELRLLGRLPGEGVRTEALADGGAPRLAWQAVTGGLAPTASAGDPAAALDADPESAWRPPGGAPCPWLEVALDPPRAIQRIETDWAGAGYARRAVLEIRTAEGSHLAVPRLAFSTSFTLAAPVTAGRVRLTLTDVARDPALASLRLLAAGPPVAAASAPRLRAWAETPLVQVAPDAAGPGAASPPRAAEVVRLALARNEYEGAQLAVRNEGGAAARDLVASVSGLAGPDGAAIASARIACHPVALVNGAWADVLLPPGPFSIPPGGTRAVWITVHAPEGQAPGTYRGTVAVASAGTTALTLPIEVEVWPVTLPRGTSFRTHYFSIWGTGRFLAAAEAEDAAHERLVRETAADFVRHRVSPGDVFVTENHARRMADRPWKEYVPEFDRWTRYWVDAGIPFVGVLSGPGARGGPKDPESWWKFWQEHLRDNGWLDRYAARVGDEPPPRNQRVTDACRQFMKWTPDLRRQCAFSSFATDGTTTWTGLVNEWGIRPRYYGDDRLSDLVGFCRDRAAAGDGVSWYVHDALSVDAPPYMARNFFWYADRCGIGGALLYGVCEWEPRDVDRWEDAFVIEGGGFKSWGVVLWPGRAADARENRLLGSARWEAVRDGIEDWELRRLLRGLLDRLAAQDTGDSRVAEGRRLLDETEALFVTLEKPDQGRAGTWRIRDCHADGPMLCTNADPQALLGARERIARAAAKCSSLK